MSSLFPWRALARRRCREIRIGCVPVGGDAPITVQSMTNTLTTDIAATVAQIHALTQAGADIVRVSCPDAASTAALATIVRNVEVPVVADIHFHYRRAIEAAEAGAACVRLNPGNIGARARAEEVVAAAGAHGCAIRIGVNGGSLERRVVEKYGPEPCPEAMVDSAVGAADMLRACGFDDFKISVKASDPLLTVAAYRLLADAVDCPLHLGVTEAGAAMSGTVRSAFALGSLLAEGIGDTVRISLAADPVEEVRVGHALLRALGLRARGVSIIACPSCARQGFDVIGAVELLEERLAHVRAPVTLSVMGCVVNGPGEAAMADVGFTGGGAGSGMLYVSGRRLARTDNADMIARVVALVEEKAEQYEHEQYEQRQHEQRQRAQARGGEGGEPAT